jgi:GNAT superfamily N-acetyltransferase
MQIRPLTGIDIPHLPGFQPADWSDIVPAFEFYLRTSFCSPLKAVAGETMVGVGAAISFGSTGWLAHIIVHPEFRRQGAGGAIVHGLVRRLRATGCRTMLLIATDMGHPVYLRAGFVDQAEYAFFDGRSGDDRSGWPDAVSSFVEADEDRILWLDREVSGEDRRSLLVPVLRGGFVYRRGGAAVDGFYLPSLGEGLIVAADDEAGLALMKVKYSTCLRAVLPCENTAGMEFLREHGFAETRRVSRMILGEPIRWRPQRLYSRIGGNLG